MKRTRLIAVFGILPCLIIFSMGCTKKEMSNSATAKEKFLAPTDVSKLTPEARANLPGGGKFQPTGPTKNP